MSMKTATLFALVCVCLSALISFAATVAPLAARLLTVSEFRYILYAGSILHYTGLIIFFATLYRNQTAPKGVA